MIKATTTILILSVLAISCLANSHLNLVQELHPLWSSWKAFHEKAYTAAEEAARFAIFIENYKKIIAFNAQSDSVKLALNHFGDMTAEEFKVKHAAGYKAASKQKGFLAGTASHVDYEVLGLPESVDWRQKGAVTPPKNQGNCGSCSFFSATGALEALYFINHGKLLSFSEQQILDCDGQEEGCCGGLPSTVFEYTAEAGIETEADYPYTAQDGKCKYDASKAIKVNTGSKAVQTNSAAALKAALVVQPVAVAIEADQPIFQFYSSGVIKGADCGASLDRAVLAVGYTTVDGEEAFIAKNSWGEYWGDKGYMYISTDGKANGGRGVCGILADPVVPTA